MNQELLYFFDKKPEALALYEAFEARVCSEISPVNVKVQKTQIAFSNKHNFAFVSFLPIRKAGERPDAYIVVTFGMGYRVDSDRIEIGIASCRERVYEAV